MGGGGVLCDHGNSRSALHLTLEAQQGSDQFLALVPFIPCSVRFGGGRFQSRAAMPVFLWNQKGVFIDFGFWEKLWNGFDIKKTL